MSHGDHGDHDMPGMPKCNLHMLWNTQIYDTCIVFKSWHISSKTGFLLSCIAIILICVFHEWVRVFQRKVDYQVALKLRNKVSGGAVSGSRGSSGRASPVDGHHRDVEDAGLLSGNPRLLRNAFTGAVVPPVSRALRAAIYGSTVFISFFLMLVFMTYNAYLIASVVIGAAIGHYVFGATMNTEAILNQAGDDKGMACH
ncbi:hypothetical protein CC1G_02280 [Coprinopsis cinerea okayama7|uniref:Copper transport protein n=1 Tax=Coprinopsis cinerea (strain Okayama-7 / 130 / ATCC MYA-4618 / FGSC 9003) TaxID=240176 RepID=A8N7M3_COPC7|nr:hypothetical protein CC1G_02280 [Coprinopsis cinerea okayama7\|eukprot:XP_001830829.2 hypothetical protein CC1G_02280 [Coprinopsis cinerea okayama7\